MKVLQVVASINPAIGGPSVTVPSLASALAAQGVSGTVAALDYGVHGPIPDIPGVELLSVPAGGLARAWRGWSPRFAAALLNCARSGADLIHGHGLWMLPNLYARRVATVSKLPLVISPRGMVDDWSLQRSALRKSIAWRLFERRNLEATRLFHATSASEARSLRQLGFSQPIAIVPNGVDCPDFASLPGRGALARRFPQLESGHWFLFMSRLHVKKGLPELLGAWQALAPEFPTWHLIVAGPDLDGFGARMRTMSDGLGLAGRITFTGMLTGAEKSAALAHSEVLVLPTHSESFGIAIAEALAHGTPVITTRGAPWEELERRDCGWWIADRPDTLLVALRAALQAPPQRRREMGARGRALVTERYSWESAARQMKAAYSWLLGAGERPDCVHQDSGFSNRSD